MNSLISRRTSLANVTERFLTGRSPPPPLSLPLSLIGTSPTPVPSPKRILIHKRVALLFQALSAARARAYLHPCRVFLLGVIPLSLFLSLPPSLASFCPLSFSFFSPSRAHRHIDSSLNSLFSLSFDIAPRIDVTIHLWKMPRQRRKGSCRSLATRTSSPATLFLCSFPRPLPLALSPLFSRRCYSPSVRNFAFFGGNPLSLLWRLFLRLPSARPRSAGICFGFIKSRLYTAR